MGAFTDESQIVIPYWKMKSIWIAQRATFDSHIEKDKSTLFQQCTLLIPIHLSVTCGFGRFNQKFGRQASHFG